VKEEGFKLMENGKKPIQEMEKEGYSIFDCRENASSTEGRTLVLADPQLYIGHLHRKTFFTMFKFHSIRFGRAATISARRTPWIRWTEMQLDLIDIKEEADKLRELLKQEKK